MYSQNLFGEPALSIPTGPTAIVERKQPDAGPGFLSVEPTVLDQTANVRFTNRGYGTVRIDIYDAAGRFVHCLLNSDVPAGHHSLTWHGRTHRDRRLPSGVYLVVLRSPGRRDCCKVVLR